MNIIKQANTILLVAEHKKCLHLYKSKLFYAYTHHTTAEIQHGFISDKLHLTFALANEIVLRNQYYNLQILLKSYSPNEHEKQDYAQYCNIINQIQTTYNLGLNNEAFDKTAKHFLPFLEQHLKNEKRNNNFETTYSNLQELYPTKNLEKQYLNKMESFFEKPLIKNIRLHANKALHQDTTLPIGDTNYTITL